MVETRLSKQSQEEVYANTLADSYQTHYAALEQSLSAPVPVQSTVPTQLPVPVTPIATGQGSNQAPSYSFTKIAPGVDEIVTYTPGQAMSGLDTAQMSLQKWLPMLALGGIAVGVWYFARQRQEDF
jgi:hypothetical protein